MEWARGLFPARSVDWEVYTATVFDDGSGPALYAGGSFNAAGNAVAWNVAKWDGKHWAPLTEDVWESLAGSVYALAVYDDGTGPALYAAGDFSETYYGTSLNGIAKWDGTQWIPLGDELGGTVSCLAVYNDGNGPALYAGGYIDVPGATSTYGIAKWDGNQWHSLESGLDGPAEALTVHNDGTGPALYVGGWFTRAGSVDADNIAKWNGSEWSAVGAGIAGDYDCEVMSLASYDDGSGPALYAGGYFYDAGVLGSTNLAKWDGSTWSAVGNDMTASVPSLCVFDDGSGSKLYVGASHLDNNTPSLASWDGTTWTAITNPLNDTITAMCGFNGELHVIGSYTMGANSIRSGTILRWSKGEFLPLGSGIDNYVNALATFDDGAGKKLYAGGTLQYTRDCTVNYIGCWNGSRWTPVGGGLDDEVSCLLSSRGTEPALYAGGYFTTAGGVSAKGIAKWDGSAWSSLGSGIGSDQYEGVFTLAEFDDGQGKKLYAGGWFETAGGVMASNIAVWNGNNWSPLGSGTDGIVRAMAVYDDGSGPALYVAGDFQTAGGITVNSIAKWDGENWSPLESGVSGSVYSLAVFNDGTGPELYLAGYFSEAGGVSANYIAKWNGVRFAPLGDGLDDEVYSLKVFDDGSGPALYAGGWFWYDGSGETLLNCIAKWDGMSWQPLGYGTDFDVYALEPYDDGSGPALYAGGWFSRAGDYVSCGIAKWGMEIPVDSMASLKTLPDSKLVSLTGPISTAAFPGVFYVESEDQSSGIRVEMPEHEVVQNQQVAVIGRTWTLESGERCIEAWDAYNLEDGEVQPIGLTSQKLTSDALTTGMLVRVWGKVLEVEQVASSAEPRWFTITDGSAISRVICPEGVKPPQPEAFVAVTGASSCEKIDSYLMRLILVRDPSDIVSAE